jgi:predicted Rossmann fold nucleotide-binding protein DprA/Smf involved in DNA uptake
MLIGSECDGVGSFPLLAGDDDDAVHSTRLSARLLREFGSGVFRAIGVIGTGIDVCYPKENKKLYERCWNGERS